MSIVARVDAFQRRHPIAGFPIAVIYKFFDDQGPFLAAIMTYYSFIAIFPLMLIATSVLGFVLQDDLELQERLLDTALAQFPIIGDQLGRPGAITGGIDGGSGWGGEINAFMHFAIAQNGVPPHTKARG